MVHRTLRLMVSPRWWWTTLLVIGGIALTVRLGIWQISRYHENQAFADHLMAMQSASPVDLTGMASADGLLSQEYRPVQASGKYDYANQVAIRNQIWETSWGNQIGYLLVTPLVLTDGSAVMVQRGWIPAEDNTPASWKQFDGPAPATVNGILRLSTKVEMGGVPDPVEAAGQRLDLWNKIDLPGLQKQVPYKLLPVYIEEAPDPAFTAMPYRPPLAQPDTSLAQTNIGYAGTWFAFALFLIGGYPLYLNRQSKPS